MKAGNAPVFVAPVVISCDELMFVQYMPIVMPGSGTRIPRNLRCFSLLASYVPFASDDYVYLTAKKSFVDIGDAQNRPGWHIDGFGSNDVNYIWSDSVPTEFCIQDFDLSEGHAESMAQMYDQAKAANYTSYPAQSLLKLDATVVHRAAPAAKAGYRTFAKLSVSKHRYNLKGNAHNYLFDYEWPMFDRSDSRNHPYVLGEE
jgi:hypothetical protein